MANTKNLVVLLASMLVAGSAHCAKNPLPGFAQKNIGKTVLATAWLAYIASKYDPVEKVYKKVTPQTVQETLEKAAEKFNAQSTTAKITQATGAVVGLSLVCFCGPAAYKQIAKSLTPTPTHAQ